MPAEVADGRVIIERTQLQARPRLRMGAQVQQSSGMKLCYDAVQELSERNLYPGFLLLRDEQADKLWQRWFRNGGMRIRGSG